MASCAVVPLSCFRVRKRLPISAGEVAGRLQRYHRKVFRTRNWPLPRLAACGDARRRTLYLKDLQHGLRSWPRVDFEVIARRTVLTVHTTAARANRELRRLAPTIRHRYETPPDRRLERREVNGTTHTPRRAARGTQRRADPVGRHGVDGRFASLGAYARGARSWR